MATRKVLPGEVRGAGHSEVGNSPSSEDRSESQLPKQQLEAKSNEHPSKLTGFWLTFEFDGLLAFVPSRNRDKLRVLLINAIRGSGTSHGGGSHGHCLELPAHYPFLRFDIKDYCPPKDELEGPDLVIKSSQAIKFFEWEDLSIKYELYEDEEDGADRRLEFMEGRRPGSAEPEHGEDNDFSWVAELEQLDPCGGEVNPSCLRSDPPRNLVIGRVEIGEGVVGATSVARDNSDNNIIWEFASGDASGLYSQALAEKVFWRVWIPSSFVTLIFKRFGGVHRREFILRPDPDEYRRQDSSNDLQVIVTVGNSPLEDVVGLKGASLLIEDRPAHFAALYKVAKNPIMPRIPRPVGHPGHSKGGTVTAGSTICLGVTYKDSDGV